MRAVDLAGGGFRSPFRPSEDGEGEGRAGARAQDAAHQPLLAHGDAHHCGRERAVLDQLEDGEIVGQRSAVETTLTKSGWKASMRCAACSRFLVRVKS